MPSLMVQMKAPACCSPSPFFTNAQVFCCNVQCNKMSFVGIIESIKREYCEGKKGTTPLTMFLELKGKIIIQERDC